MSDTFHLTYCLNIHAGETWAETAEAITTHVPQVKIRFAPDRPFGLGLRLSARAAHELRQADHLLRFKEWMMQRDCYAFTVNGFPYGHFHGKHIKTEVYRPDWRDPARQIYTNDLAEILASLLPDGMVGSISTVPGAFGRELWDASQKAERVAIIHGLHRTATQMRDIYDRTGRRILVALEPEPGCLLETAEDAVTFFEIADRELQRASACFREWTGICIDTCHAACRFHAPVDEWDVLNAAHIRVPKIQLSAALKTPVTPESLTLLKTFDDGVYLHQTSLRTADGVHRNWLDLPQAINDLQAMAREPGHEMRVHCHVPLYWQGDPPLTSTAHELNEEFFARLRASDTHHIEVETYTFSVLPPALRILPVAESVARELTWAHTRLRTSRLSPPGIHSAPPPGI